MWSINFLTFFWLFFGLIFRSKKRAIAATTNSDDEDVDALRYVCILAEFLPVHQTAFSPESLTPKKVRTKEPLSHSKSIKSAFVLLFILHLFWKFIVFLFNYSGKKRMVASSEEDGIFVGR
jgi:hypothetical protein